MTPAQMLRAAEVLEREAEVLSRKLGGAIYPVDYLAMAVDHDEMLSLAAALRQMAGER